MATVIQTHLDTLPLDEAQALRKEIHELAVKSSRAANRGKASRSRKTEDSRPLSRISAKSA